ncbi:filamentous haemagglutinin family protein [Pseudomonas haemolytica]|uniref:Filamentous hemagglutinin N-terminal domain-containing protein n=1 Tax=Pseudomonas haemolytica TaxID=2600065 RepID=A0A5P1DG19_9PSED|nr:filamentous haemagglutinin family protein [Pseudomonas haemolytica]MBJ2248146.1 filamentous hemagglutinin family protein [Pseudomonas haemolytica]MBJ2274339.1 filamentous hemagglutinin family protein [Pseudomonas haemolytica]MBK3448844.1 filamentous hemagglutinin family protein [Pseudomonas haemolytica]MBK3460063.1 filamentous hemagglutinin family protein [Pseudomonas haemolytica]MRJ39467.1 filamentous hemagglutinin N-terminal domain-containing protein [Pseudomonas haemolytica]
MRSRLKLPATRAAKVPATAGQVLLLKPLAQVIALLVFAGGAHAAQPQAFSSGWFAAKGAAQAAGSARPGVVVPGTPPPLSQQQRGNEQLQRSLQNLNTSVAAIAAQQAAQAAARNTASAGPQTIHNGLGGNGLNVVIGADGKPLFVNAEGPVQTDANGKTLVSIKQTADKAILNWQTFNVGRDTTVQFQQNSDWAVLNKINNSTAPSQIQGAIKADGTVMIVNGNGVVFSGSSQVNVRNLVAAATAFSDEQFTARGLYSSSSTAPSFAQAAGNVTVERGAQINTQVPATSTAGGGYVLLLGKEVTNAGSISTARGQTTLAAGDSFVIKKGYSTDGNVTSTTRGNEVSATGSGKAGNSGLIQAATGDITLTGQQVLQNGVLLTSSSVEARGTLHLKGTGNNASVTLGEGSVSAILLDSSNALDSQRAGLITPSADQAGNVVPADVYRRDQSLVEITSDASVDFRNGSLTLATGGQVGVKSTQRTLVREGAVIDVSGAIGVKLAMESNSVKVNIQGNEQRDAPVNRDGKVLNNNDVWVDVRDLVFVPAGTHGYATDRWYTAGGLLEVGGYLGTRNHAIGEWMAQGGTVSFSGKDVVTQQGSQINLSGGTLDVQSGKLQQTWLKGPGGRLYELSSAPGDLLYTGIYKGYEDNSQRWGVTDYYYNPLIAPRERSEAGYTVGRDAGRLVVSTASAVLEGQVVGDTYQGERQTQAAQKGLDGYLQSQKAVARGAALVVGSYVPYYVKDSAQLQYALGADTGTVKNVVLGQRAAAIAAGLDLNSVLSAERASTLYLNSDALNAAKLGAINIASSGSILVNGALEVASAGDITLFAPKVEVNANLTAHSGSLQLGNVLTQITPTGKNDVTLGGRGSLTVNRGVSLDTSGLWSNQWLSPGDSSRLPYLNGGSVALRSSADVTLAAGSRVDVSSGAALDARNQLIGGKGGDLTLAANANSADSRGNLALNGELLGYGVNGGGRLSVQAGKVLISAQPVTPQADTLQLDSGFFNKGFGAYDITGNEGLRVADGTQVDVTAPLYRLNDAAQNVVSGADSRSALQIWTPPQYRETPTKGQLTVRKGASLNLQAGSALSTAAQMATVQARIGQGAVINVDPGQSIGVRSIGQLTVDGTLNAWGGNITLGGVSVQPAVADGVEAKGHDRSIWIGEHAVLDVAARAATAVDSLGRRYGVVGQGGNIVIGGVIDPATGIASAANLFVVVREGARLDASGSQAVLDLSGAGSSRVASRGGSISLASNNGLYLDGTLTANSGGAGAAGGSLNVALETPLYLDTAAATVRQARELIVSAADSGTPLPNGSTPEAVAGALTYGHGRLTVRQVNAGGFDNLSLLSNGLISFDGDLALHLGQSLSLYSGAMALTDGAARHSQVLLAAPYVRLAGVGNNSLGTDNLVRPTVQGGVSTQAAAGLLRVAAANVLDVRDSVNFGAHAASSKALANAIDRRAFDQAHLVSQGDMRFLARGSDTTKTALTTQADLNLSAAQIYPATGAVAQVTAGYTGGDFDPARTLRIGRVGSTAPAQPYSVFGSLVLAASTIEQGGVLRAPMGSLTLGVDEGITRSTKAVKLLPGSLTSVSAGGLVLPYGGTVDGVTWQYDGKQVELLGVGGTRSTGNVAVGVELAGRSLNVQQDAVLDLSGGGQLLGAAFISGRGGSTDARYNPLMQMGADGRFTLPGLATNPIYAIVPGGQPGVAPSGGEAGATQPLVGQQISLGAGVPGLPPGTYTLLPSTYALLPGAFRVEINGLAAPFASGSLPSASVMNNGSWSTEGLLSIAGTGIRDSLSSQVIVTPAAVLRRYSQYNETAYADFVRADATRLGVPRAALEADAKTLKLRLVNGEKDLAFNFDGEGRFKPAQGGFGATVAVLSSGDIEVISDTAQASSGASRVSVRASDLNALGAARLVVGGEMTVVYGQGGNFVRSDLAATTAGSVVVRQGATLAAPEVFLVTGRSQGAIEIEQGASINTLGRGKAAYDSDDGFIYRPGNRSVLAVSNGRLQMLAPTSGTNGLGPGSILIGQCTSGACGGETSLYSEGSIAFATTNRFALGDSVRYGTRHLALAVGGINVGSAEALAEAAARGVLPSGLTLNQQVLDRLLRGDTGNGAPALKSLALTAGQSLNFYGSTRLSTLDSAGKSLLDELMLTTPAIYGYGAASDVALIQTGTLVWGGDISAPPAVISNGAGTGSGTLELQARRIEFGYGRNAQPDSLANNGRMTLGFANVNLNASERITANHKGNLSVHQAQGAYEAGKGFTYSGGNLNITTPLLTGEAGSVNRISAGGTVNVKAPANGAAPVAAGAIDALGAELLLSGHSVALDTSVVLPSGKLTLSADQALTLGAASRLDLSGRKVQINDVSQYSWGGDVSLESRHGDIRQAAGALIDLSAQFNQGGLLKAVAVDTGAGQVDLQGHVRAGSSGYYDAGGTLVPYKAGGVDIRAQQVGDFAALNQRLNQGQVFGSRSFQLKQGNLVIGDELKANQINVSVDNGSLTVVGTLDASGERVGSIRLAAKQGVTVAGSAVLDAHGTALRVDSYGKIIDAPNRAMVELNSGDGQLSLAEGVRIDLRHGTAAVLGSGPGHYDGVARGTLELNAPRLNADDVAIDASGALNVQGARSIAVNAVARYTDAPVGIEPSASGRPYQVIDQHYLEQKHALAQAFINNALNNAGLMTGKLAGLNNSRYTEAFHLRPGVEIVTQGDLVVSGDLDLSGYRYASVNPNTPKTSVYGSGEVGGLVVRAGGNINIYGSINDGFAPPPATPDDNGWVLTPGLQGFGADVIVPGPGVVLANGSAFPTGKTLNYPLPIQATTLAQGTVLPTQGTLDAPLSLPANTVLSAAVHDSAGNLLYAAGTLLQQPVVLAAGTQLDAGTVLAGAASLRAMTWPAGVPLPSRGAVTGSATDGVVLAGNLALKVGALIPYGTDVKLPNGAVSVPLRTVTGATARQNWAVAPMLAEGSQSWSLRLVSGADTQAADTRSIQPAYAGDLTLADTHYGIYQTHEKIIVPGQPARPGGAWYWSDFAAELFGVEAGTAVPEPEWGSCDEPDICVRVNYVWSDIAEIFGFVPGQPVSPQDESFCDPEMCVSLGEPIPAIPEKVTIGEVKLVSPVSQHFSVLRTGTGDLDLIAAGNVAMQSPYGIYTAGGSSASRAGSAAADFDRARAASADGTVLGSTAKAYEALVDDNSPYAAWYPDAGGNLLLRTGGSLTADVWTPNQGVAMPNDGRTQLNSGNLGNWLWRQGTGNTPGVTPTPTSWWINFGTYVKGAGNANIQFEDAKQIDLLPRLVGFTGVGTLGGGNLTLDLGSDAGMQTRRGSLDGGRAPRSEGLVLAVGSTGRLVDGQLLLTGGGDLDVRMGGDLNPGLDARATRLNTAGLLSADFKAETLSLNGVFTNLRGALNLQAGSLGGIALNYGGMRGDQDAKDTRAYSPYTASLGTATGGITLMLGDATANLSTRGDLVLAGAGDPGRVSTENNQAFSYNGKDYGNGTTWFSLWTERTAIDLFSAGGSLTPSVQSVSLSAGGSTEPLKGQNYSSSDGRFIFPSKLGGVAANGSIYLGASALGSGPQPNNPAYSLLLAPSSNGRLAMLAGDSIYASGYAVNQSGDSLGSIPTPFAPAFVGRDGFNSVVHNLGSDALQADFSLFALRSPTDLARPSSQAEPARFYARQGDIVGVRSGEIITFNGSRQGQVRYESVGPVWIRAGRDIVSSGTYLGSPTLFPALLGYNGDYTGESRGNLFVHSRPEDVSVVSAGRDIIYSSFNVAGPGALEVSAGRNLLMEDKASITSLGPVVAGDSRPGASIVLEAGVGPNGLDYLKFVTPYLDRANQAVEGVPLATQAGKVAKTYEAELLQWLKQRYAFSGDADQARAYFAGLGPEQQRLFARTVYFAEVREGGREFNLAAGPRAGSFVRSRVAIDGLLPSKDVAGNPIMYDGDITLYGGAGVHTLFGGNIQMLTPGGQQVFGIEGTAPPATAGVLTQGAGDIQLYAQGSILLGQSRIMTTFGGSILAWSNAGDINAGRGAKTTVLYTPPKRVYDTWGNVTLSPNVPSSGAGIATLAPIAEVPAGDIDLLAPAGTIDAGEAGIRVSGNVNIAALHVVNAANIQTQGKSSGVPVTAAVNTGAMTSASAAGAAASQAAEDAARSQQAAAKQGRASIVTVEVLGFGTEPVPREPQQKTSGYNPDSPVQVLGAGPLSEQARARLTDEERKQISL